MKGIDSKKEYSVNEIAKLQLLGRTQSTTLRKILEDRLTDNLLKVEIGGTPSARRYKVKGANLIKYLNAQDPLSGK